MHRLSSNFILGYHGCDEAVGSRLLAGDEPKQSGNAYDWLGPGIYFWEANPGRGLDFARETSKRNLEKVPNPTVVGAIIDLGLCLDLTTKDGIDWLGIAYRSLEQTARDANARMYANSPDGLRRNLDRAVIEHLHSILNKMGMDAVDTVKGIFTEGSPVYPGAGFYEKTHVQIAV